MHGSVSRKNETLLVAVSRIGLREAKKLPSKERMKERQ